MRFNYGDNCKRSCQQCTEPVGNLNNRVYDNEVVTAYLLVNISSARGNQSHRKNNN